MRDAASMRTDNLLDALEGTLHAVDADAFRVVPNLRQQDTTDVGAITRNPELATCAMEALNANPMVAVVERRQQRFSIRLADDRIAEVGAGLEGGRFTGMETGDLRAHERAIVDFCDPNATKALHVGHLRNIALGRALSSALRAAGATIECQSHIGDAGRSMGEAMAGYQRYAAPSTPADVAVKSDHFVGELYARYAREEGTTTEVAEADAPVARDLDERHDLAQQLLSKLEEEDPDTVELWKRIRDWAVEGQNATLARLGVRFERIVYDSERTRATAEVARLGIERGVFVKEPRGTIAYLTGEDSYPVMPLTRADGFPTHHLRVVAMWRDLMIKEKDAGLIHLSGDEWKAHVHHVEELLRKLEPDLNLLPSQHILHGMVSTEIGGELSSSKGDALLIDTLLEGLSRAPELKELAREGQPLVTGEDLVAMTVLGYCLDRPVVKGLALPHPQELLDSDRNTGWKFAEAWARAWDPVNDGSPDPQPEDSAYRHIVLRAQLHRRNLAVALEGLDLLKYVRYVCHLSEWFLEAEHDPRVARVMRAILTSGFGALGLIRVGTDEARAEALRRAGTTPAAMS
jgi:hypothetical protein